MEEIGGVGESLDIKEGYVILESKSAGVLDISINREEVEVYLKNKKKNCKAAGLDEIPYEFHRNGGMIVLEKMTEFFNTIWEYEKVSGK